MQRSAPTCSARRARWCRRHGEPEPGVQRSAPTCSARGARWCRRHGEPDPGVQRSAPTCSARGARWCRRHGEPVNIGNGPADTPGSVRPARAGRDGHLSRDCVAAALQRSTRGRDEQPHGPLCDLAPGEVYRAGRVTPVAGGLLPHRFTLAAGTPAAVCSLWHCLAGHPGWVLPTALLFGARTFLGAGLATGDATVWPTRSATSLGGAQTAGRMRIALLSGQSSTSSGAALRTTSRSEPSRATPVALVTPPTSSEAPTPYRARCFS